MASLKNILADPDVLPHAIEQGHVVFVKLPRKALTEITFLDDAALAPYTERLRVPLPEIVEWAQGVQPTAHYIFHTAFCCSTLLARALDVPGEVRSLKEPNLLVQLARLKRDPEQATQLQPLLTPLLKLLAHHGGERVLIKPGNVANNLLLDAAGALPGAKFVLLYSALPEFVGSIVRKGLEGRIFARRLYMTIKGEVPLQLGMSPEQELQLTDLQIAALAWLQQISWFKHVLGAVPEGRACTLDSAVLLERKADTISGVADHFGLHLTQTQAAEIADGPVFARHSKTTDDTFVQGARDNANAETLREYADEINKVLAWAGHIASANQLALPPETALRIGA